MPRVADLVFAPRHSAPLDGAAVGEAEGGERLLVRIGVWTDGRRVARARWRATTCAALIAYAEAACAALEGGEVPDAPLLRARVEGVHPVHHGRADLVADAARRALARATGDPA